jgi:hypothetical protein
MPTCHLLGHETYGELARFDLRQHPIVAGRGRRRHLPVWGDVLELIVLPPRSLV